MSWQDELRELDDELAEGLISATEYRRRSEDLIAAASASPAKPAALPGAKVSGAAPERVEPDNPAPHPREPACDESAATRAPPADPPEPSFHPVPAPAGSPDGRGVTTAQRDPVADAFAPPVTPRRGGPRRRWFAVGAALVVLVAATVWYVGFRFPASDPGTPAAANAAPVTVSDGLAAKLPRLPGRPVSSDHTIGVGKLAGLGLGSGSTAGSLRAHGVSQALYLSSVSEGDGYLVVAIPNHSRVDARRVTGDVLATQHRRGLAGSDRMGLPTTVSVLARVGDTDTVLRAVYTSGKRTVVVGATGTDGSQGLAAGFASLAKRVTGVLPAR